MFLGFRFYSFFLDFNLQMPDTKLRPTSTMKSKDKSSFAKIRPCERHKSKYKFEYHFYRISYTISEKTYKFKIRIFEVFKVFFY